MSHTQDFLARRTIAGAVSATALLLASCGGGGGGVASPAPAPPSGGTPPPPPPPVASQVASFSGVAVAGWAACELSLVGADGAVLATAASGADGRFAFDVEVAGDATAPAGAARLVADNCAFADEYTGDTVTGASLSALLELPSPFDGSSTELVLSPFTRLADPGVGTDGAATAVPGDADMSLYRARLAALSAQLLPEGSLGTLVPAVAVDPASAEAAGAERAHGLALAAVSALGELDAALDTLSFEGEALNDASADALLDAAGMFELSGRNASGEAAPAALAGLAGDRVEGNRAPVAGNPPKLTAVAGEDFALDLSGMFTDPDGDALVLRAAGLPEGARLEDGSLLGSLAEGAYPFTVSGFDARGGGATLVVRLVVGPAAPTPPPMPNVVPEAHIKNGVRSGEAPLAVRFDGTDSTDPDGTLVGYSWDFGNGLTAEGAVAGTTYTEAGTYTARLTVTDNRGARASATTRVSVSAPPPPPPPPVGNENPVARISGGNRTGEAPLSVSFDASGSTDSDGTITAYSWLFGDGTGAKGATVSHNYTTPGTYTAQLTVTDDDGATDTTSVQVSVTQTPNRPPVARIADGVRAGEAPLDVAFDAGPSTDSDGRVVAYSWNFGDGATASGAKARHTYTNAGMYTATLTVTDDGGATDATSVSVSVGEPPNRPPEARIEGGDRSGAAPLSLNFSGAGSTDADGTIKSYSWDFGDGTRSEGARVSHTFTAPGTYSVSLRVTDDDGDTDRASVVVTVAEPPNRSPEAAIAEGVRSGEAPLTVRFDGTPSTDPDGTIAGYRWDFGDSAEATGVTARHTYSAPGSYVARLTVTDDDGATDSTTVSVAVGEPPNQPPTALIAGGDRSGEAPFTVQFDGTQSTDSDGTVAAYFWRFGTGDTSRQSAPGYTFAEPGTYSVRLAVTDDDGDTGRASVTVTVAEPPNAAPRARIAGGGRTGEAPFAVSFDGSGSTDSDGSVASYAWTFGDGTSATGAKVSHTYTEAGTFRARLTVTDDDGATNRAGVDVVVSKPANRAPTAVLNNADRRIELGKSSRFRGPASSDPDGQIVAWAWDMGDGTVKTDAAFNYTYKKTGTYTVTLTVTDDDGATGSATGTAEVYAPAANAIAMPIEVLGTGAPGTTTVKSREFTLGSASGVERLSLTCHRCDYRDSGVNPDRGAKASLRVNGGKWVDVTDAIADVSEPEKSYGGIKGAYHTVRFTVPVSGLVDGDNRVEFRFNGTDGFTNGYRLIRMNLLDSAGREVLPEGDFVWDDPTTWEPPRDTPSDIRNGRELWEGKVALRESPLSDKVIRAACASCHASDGSDLKYFNYSNDTIKVRAQFHGLSALQGERIASYVRDLDTPAPKQARPWNPPYQPGPGLDSRPVEEWAAGAGLEAVLDTDAEMLGDLFPNGTSDAAIRKVTSTRNTLNAREQRIALQLPDWKMWLPEVHPVDIWGDDWEATRANQSYLDALAQLDGNVRSLRKTERDVQRQTLLKIVDEAVQGPTSFISLSGPQPCENLDGRPYRSEGFALLGKGPQRPPKSVLEVDPDACETMARSMMHWMAVKQWELHTRFGLEDAAPDLYPYGEARSWLGGYRAVFNMAPHRSGNDSQTFLHLTKAESSYLSTAWYQLQVILNAGNRNPQNHRPPDWKYQMNWLHIAALENDHPAPLRYVQTLIKMQQNLDMRAPVEQPGGAPRVPDYFPFQDDRGIEGQNGWWLLHSIPWRYVSVGGSSWVNDADRFAIWNQLDDVEPGLRRRLQTALLRDWLDKTESYDISGIDRERFDAEPADYVPTAWDGVDKFIAGGKAKSDGLYRVVPFLREAGVRENQINRLIDWGEKMWPLGDWDALRL